VAIIALVALTVQTGGTTGGGNFALTAYQGSSSLGGTNVDFDQVRLAAAGKPIVLNFWGDHAHRVEQRCLGSNECMTGSATTSSCSGWM
jgi:hypothetical protein